MRTAMFNPYQPVLPRPHERKRSQWGMALFIATEAMLFVIFFFAYFFLASHSERWPFHEDPSFKLALVLLVILLVSSVTAHLGQRGIERGDSKSLNLWLIISLLLGVAFMTVQYFEFSHHLKSLTPTENAYGSIFYTIVSFHLAHVILGFMMLAYVLARSLAGHFSAERHIAVKNVVWYWHFVDLVWIVVVSILYLSPHFYGAAL